MFDADCRISYILNSGVTDPKLTKFLQGVQKWLLITILKSKFDHPILFGMPRWRINVDRQIAAKVMRFNNVNSEIIGQKVTKFVHDVAELFRLILWKQL